MTKNEIFENYFKDNKDDSLDTTANLVEEDLASRLENNTVNYRANGNINVEKFTDALKNLLDDTWEDGWGEFTDGVPKGAPEDITFPRIIFDLLKRVPSKHKKGIKQRLNEIRIDENNPDYTLLLSRQWFDCDCRFIIAHNTNREAYELRDRFENLMNNCTGYLKQQGVHEIVFMGEEKYEPDDKILSDKSIKCLRYLMIFEKIDVERVRTTKTLLSQIKAQTRLQSS